MKPPAAYDSATPFQQRLYRVLMQIPTGRVTTYGALARALGCRSPRAIGGALRKNPDAPRIPCHRVIASDGSLGGFMGQRHGAAIDEKRQRLKAEGVDFDHNGLIDRGRLWTPSATDNDERPSSDPSLLDKR